jgi:hypothetical protein
MHSPSPGHIEVVKHLGRYIFSTMELGLQFTSLPNSSLESYIHFPLSNDGSCSSDNNLTTFCDANWGPQDASRPSPCNTRLVSIDET